MSCIELPEGEKLRSAMGLQTVADSNRALRGAMKLKLATMSCYDCVLWILIRSHGLRIDGWLYLGMC